MPFNFFKYFMADHDNIDDKDSDSDVMNRREAMGHGAKVTMGTALTLSNLTDLMTTPAYGSEKKEVKPMSLAEARECVTQRISMMKLSETTVHCGDDRADEGTAAFGAGLMGVLYPVAKEIERRQGMPLTDEQIDMIMDCYEGVAVLHTDDGHGLGHVAEEIENHTFLRQFFSEGDLKILQEQGFEGNAHIERLAKSVDGPKIIEALATVSSHIGCQGCGHVVTVLKDEIEQQAHGNGGHDSLAAKIVKKHVARSIAGSPKHKIAVYKGPHNARAVIELKRVGEIKGGDDLVPSRRKEGSHEAFFNEPQVAEYLISEVSRKVCAKMNGEEWAADSTGIAKGALEFHQAETGKTALRLAQGLPVFTANYNENGLVDVVDSGTVA